MKHPSELLFEAPGPGVWRVDGLHTPKPITRLKEEGYLQIPKGMKIGTSRYGALSNGIEIAVLHRFVYASPRFILQRPPGDDAHAAETLRDLVAADPEIQERFARAEDAMRTKRWRRDREHWDTVGRPWMMGRTLMLTDMDPASLDDMGLQLHIEECQHHLCSSMYYHHILNLVPALPKSLLFLKTMEWTGMPLPVLEPLLVGSSPISAGDEPEMRALVDAIEQDGSAVAMLNDAGAPADVLAALAARKDAAGDAYRAFVRMVGYRTVDGWEPMNPYILESPGLLLDKIRHGMRRDYASLDVNLVQEVRQRVPAAFQADFDELLDDARTNSRIKDERDLYCNIPMCGLLRRAVMEAGRRIADRGLIQTTEHVTEASIAEINDLLIDGRSDMAEELSERYAYRQRYSIDDIPESLGRIAPSENPINPDWLPEYPRLMLQAMGVQMMMMVGPEPEQDDSNAEVLKGKPVSPGQYEGIARVVREASEIESIQQGEVLVTRSTNPAFNVVLPRLGALVTEYGGLLSHAAIVSREFGLPGIVGCRKITQKVSTGDRVRVDGDTGEITLLS
jgi:pyruvate,water dikinase